MTAFIIIYFIIKSYGSPSVFFLFDSVHVQQHHVGNTPVNLNHQKHMYRSVYPHPSPHSSY